MPGPSGVWLAYYSDMSGVVPFCSEVEALRHAVQHGMQVKFARFGDDEWRTSPDPKPEQSPTYPGLTWNHPAGARETRPTVPGLPEPEFQPRLR